MIRRVLDARTLLEDDGIALFDVACRHPAGRGRDSEQSGAHALVFVRRGCFIRSVDGREALLDPTVAYCMNPGEEQRYDHPHEHGDDCTSIGLDEQLAASLWGGEPTLPGRPLPVSPRLDFEHRMLLAAARRGGSPHELAERAVELAASALAQAEPARVAAGRPSTRRARRALVDGVREALIVDPDRSLLDLAAGLAVSPHHLSRVFRRLTGHTIARHRMRLRARAALERLAGGERDLARLAAEVGFADQSHLCRVIRSETGMTPAALRASLQRVAVASTAAV
jgi:AraC-like DNA-binding protein